MQVSTVFAPLLSKHLHPQSNSANGESPHQHINYPTGSQRSATLSTEDGTIRRRFDSRVASPAAVPRPFSPLPPFVVTPRLFSHLDAKWPSAVAGGWLADGRDTAARWSGG